MALELLVLVMPKALQSMSLRYGIVGAFAFRSAATVLAALLIRLGWGKLVGAGDLLYLVYRHFGGDETAEERRAPKQPRGWLRRAPVWCTAVKVGLSDTRFAIASL